MIQKLLVLSLIPELEIRRWLLELLLVDSWRVTRDVEFKQTWVWWYIASNSRGCVVGDAL